MLKSMAHGGPDDEGIYQSDQILFGHRRLSIIDLSPAGHQPMISDDGQIIITFNGEIYNFCTVKDKLIAKGHSFITHSDTEVIIYAYKEWGRGMFNYLEGMFALAIYDKEKQILLLARDHAGIKPLYFYRGDNQFVFASEVRAFQFIEDCKENPDWKILFLAFGSMPAPFTTFDQVFQLAKGSYLELNLNDLSYNVNSYSKQDINPSTIIQCQDLALNSIREKMESALKDHLIADAPLGVFLSGGIDSSLLTLLADKYKTGGLNALSVNFKEADFDEKPFQNLVLQNTTATQHVSYEVNEDMFVNKLDDIWNAMDQPSIDGVNSYFVSKCAKENGLKAVLSGIGADEYFGGYGSFSRVGFLPLLRFVPLKKIWSRFFTKIPALHRSGYLCIPGAVGDYLFLRGIHAPDTIAKLLGISEQKVWRVLKNISVCVPANLTRGQYASFLETEFYMSNQLLKDTDCMSMWHSLEVRVPFLDQQLLKQAERIDSEIRFKSDSPKFLLTASFKDVLPPQIVHRRKQGFTFPFKVWLKNRSKLFLKFFTDNEEANRIHKKFMSDEVHWSKFWSVLVLHHFESKASHFTERG